MNVMVEDLRFAQQASKAVEIHFFGMPKVFTGIVDVDEDAGIVTIREPQYMGDETTRRRVSLSDIASVTVTEIDY